MGTKAVIFAAFTCFFAAIAFALLGIGGLGSNYAALLAAAAFVLPGLMPLFEERPKTYVVPASVIGALVILLLIYRGNTALALPPVSLFFSLLIMLSIPLMELRDDLFKNDK